MNGVESEVAENDEIESKGLELGGGNENWYDYLGIEAYAVGYGNESEHFENEMSCAGSETYAVNYEDGWQKVLRGGKIAKTAKPEREVYAINVQGEWEKITFTGDSEAVDHVVTKETAKAFKIVETSMSKAGIGLTAANGTRINNYGAKKLNGVTQQGDGFSMKVQVTDAKRNLASFPKMVEEGNDIFLSKNGCWIKNEKSGLQVPMRLKPGGTPEFDVYVKKAEKEKLCRPCGQFSVLNEDGDADIKDSEVDVFTRLERLI